MSEWSKEQGLGPCRVGVRGFEPHPPHQIERSFIVQMYANRCSLLSLDSPIYGLKPELKHALDLGSPFLSIRAVFLCAL